MRHVRLTLPEIYKACVYYEYRKNHQNVVITYDRLKGIKKEWKGFVEDPTKDYHEPG